MSTPIAERSNSIHPVQVRVHARRAIACKEDKMHAHVKKEKVKRSNAVKHSPKKR